MSRPFISRNELPLAMAIVASTLVAAAWPSSAQQAGGFWVVGNRDSQRCEIVTSNPVVTGIVGGPIEFSTGPYGTRKDAKKARNGLSACPKVDDDADD